MFYIFFTYWTSSFFSFFYNTPILPCLHDYVIPYKWFLNDVTSTPNILFIVWIFEPPSITSIAKTKDASFKFPFFFKKNCHLPIWVARLCALRTSWIWITSSCALATMQINIGPCALIDCSKPLGLLDQLDLSRVVSNACTFSFMLMIAITVTLQGPLQLAIDD